MNTYTRIALVALFFLVMPMKHWAQQPTQIKVSEFNISSIESIEERVFVIHSIQEQGYHCFRSTERPNTVEVYMPSDSSDEMADFDFFFDHLYDNELVEFSSYDKDLRGELFILWRQELDDELFAMLYEDFTRGIATENSTCETALPFCTDNGAYTFPAGVDSGSPCGTTTTASCSDPYRCTGTPGQSTYCLSTAPNPAFYYLKIATTGNLNIKIYSEPRYDIDFDCWGPFDDPTTACSLLSCSNIVDCSYAGGSDDEFCHINNAVPNKYYILLLTNYGNHQCNIIFENVGTGTTDCGILPPLVSNDGPYCVGETIQLHANGQAGATYSWTGPGGFSSNQQNPTRPNCTMNMAGTYTCTITIGSQTNSATTDVVIYPQPTANFTFNSVCRGNPTQFTSTSTTNPAGQQITSYQWNFGDGQTSTQQNPLHTYANAGTYTVTLTVACGNGLCTSTKTQTVTVYAEPTANAGPDQTIPYGATAQLSGSGGAGTFNFHWEPANMVVNPNAQNTQTVPLTADQTYTLTVTNPQGNCSNTDEVTIHISGSSMTVTALATPPYICEGSSTQLQANAGGGSGEFTFAWTPTTNLSNPDIYNPIANPTETTTYTCHVTDVLASYSIDVSVTVVVHHAGFSEETHYICPDDLYEWHDQIYSDIGDYEYLTQTQYGCDSTVTLHLRHYPTYDETTIEEAICYGEQYVFYGTAYSMSGQYAHTDHTIHGCDSIVRLNLTVYPDNGVTQKPVTVCPEQLPYNFYGVNYFEETDVTVLDTDVHGCDSAVRLILTVSDYYMPEIVTKYVCYEDTPYYEWYIPEAGTTLTYTEPGLHIDTLPTPNCDGIFRLNLQFQQIPETVVIDTTVCDNFTWHMTGETFTQSGEYYHRIPLSPFPCEQVYKLDLTVNKSDLSAEQSFSNQCDSIPFNWMGETIYFKSNGVYPLSGETTHGCDSLMTVVISNMKYTPNPSKIRCSDGSAVVFGDTIAVVTNTEFFSFQYTFYVEESNRECVWQSCDWTISKPSWNIVFSPNPTLSHNGKYYSECTVYVADRQEENVVLTATIHNGCGTEERKFYLKSSFLDVEENNNAIANVNIVPNPNNGQMHIDFENMEGRTSIKVFDMTGNQIDAFETYVNSSRYNYDYNMKRYAEGIYFFVVSNNNRVLTKKVVIIH